MGKRAAAPLLGLLASCGPAGPIFLASPPRQADGWLLATHDAGGAVEVRGLRDWSSPLEFGDGDVELLELLAYDRFELPVGMLPRAHSDGLITRPLPSPDAVFRADLRAADLAFVEQDAPSPALLDFEYGAPTGCLALTLSVHEAVGAYGETAVTFVDDDTALGSMGPTHYRLTKDRIDELEPCGVALHYGRPRARADGTHLVLSLAPNLTVTLRFDIAGLACEVISTSPPPVPERWVVLDENLSGDQAAPIFALTSSGSLSRYRDDGTWLVEREASPNLGQVFEDRAILLQIEPGLLVGSFGESSIFSWTAETGMHLVPLPPSSRFAEPQSVTSMTYVPSFGLVVALDGGSIYEMNPRALGFEDELHDFGAPTKFLVPFDAGMLALLKEGPAVQIRSDEICLPGTSVSGGSLLSVAANGDAVVGLYREDPRRLVRWLSVE